MKMIACFLVVGCVVVGGYLGSPRSVYAERGLIIEGVKIADKHGKEILLYQESHALVIGVSNYTDWPRLPGVQHDVQEIKAALETHGFNVVVYLDVDKNELEQAFNDFINQYGYNPENRLLFYFAGHGHTMTLATGVEMGYIVPASAPNPYQDEQGFLANAIDMQMFESYAKRIQAKHALFLFDSCFSGSLFAISRAVPEHITYKTANPIRQFITSGSADEQVPDESFFRQQFIMALKGAGDTNGDGYVTGSELGLFLEDTVINYSKGTQHPQYGKIRDPNLDKGDFVFQVSVTIVIKVPPTPETPVAPMHEVDPETAMWKLIETSENIQDVKDFLAAFPDGKFAKVAQLKLKQLERQQRQQEHAVVPTPLPTATPVPLPTVSEVDRQIAQLLDQADAYFERQWYTTPEDSNAFDVYREVLTLDPDNEQALQQIAKIARFYKSRAEREERQGRTEQAIQYYQRYLKIAPNDDAILDKVAELKEKHFLELATPTPAPTPISIVATPTPKPTRMSPTPTPRPKPVIRLRSKPGTFSQDTIKNMAQTKGFYNSTWNPQGDFPNEFEAKALKGDRVVIDHATGLMWQQAVSSHLMKWRDVQAYVDRLNLDQYAGFSDWRLPTVEELMSLLEPNKQSNDLYINPVFDSRQVWCWSADKAAGSSRTVWCVDFARGSVGWDDVYGGDGGVRCVRSPTPISIDVTPTPKPTRIPPTPTPVTSQTTKIIDMSWDRDMEVIEIELDEFPSTWGNWTMYVDGVKMPMKGGVGNPIVRPNAPLDEPPTGLFVGTDPWVTGLGNVDFPCCGTIQFDIPGEGLTNQYEFNLVDRGCETASEKECPSEWTHHSGDLVIDGTETFIIEDAQYFQQGNIYVNAESRLVIRNSKLMMGRGDVPTVHVYLFVDPLAEVEIDNSQIFPESGLVCVFNHGTVTMTDSPTSIHYFDMSDGAQLTMVNSEMVFTIGGLLQATGGNTTLIDSTIGALGLKVPADAHLNISGLESGAYFEYWDVHDMIPEADYDLVLERSRILEDDFTGELEHGPYERGWLFFLDPDAHVRISDSKLRKVFIDVINDNVEFENLKVGIPSSLSYRDIELTDVIVMGQWPFTIIDSHVTISDSDYLFLQPSGDSRIYLQNSHMVEFIPRDFSGVMVFETGIWTEAGEIIGGVPYHSMYNDFTIKGSLMIEDVRENLQWKDAQVTREFDVLVTDESNTPIKGAFLKIDESTYVSDNVGKATFSLIFNENNYDQPKNLEISVGGSLIAREEIDFFTETPIILTVDTTPPMVSSTRPTKGEACSLSVWSVAEDAVIHKSEGTRCELMISCGGFNSEAEAYNGLSLVALV